MGPRSVGVVHWQHPNRGPQPITSREFGGNLNSAVFDGGALLGINSSRLNRLNDCSSGGVGNCDTVGKDIGRASSVSCEVDYVV